MAQLKRSLDINLKRLPADHPELGNQYINLGLVHLKRKEYAQAEVRFRETLTLWQGRVPQEDPNWAWAWWGLGRVLLETGRAREAEPWLRKAYQLRVASLPEDQRDLLEARDSLAEAERALSGTPAAEP